MTLSNRIPGVVPYAGGDAFSGLVVQIFQLDGLLTAAGDALAIFWEVSYRNQGHGD